MGIEALYRNPNTSKKHPKHRIYPYPLRDMVIIRPNQVWAMDMTYIPMAKGFAFRTAVIDWATRRVLAHRASITMHAQYCVEALQEAINRYAKSEIMNNRSGQPVHRSRLHSHAQRQRHPDQHGWQGLLARQRVCETAVEEREVRGGLSPSLRLGKPGQNIHRSVSQLLQYPSRAFITSRPNP
jgi:transposase InsO family protein